MDAPCFLFALIEAHLAVRREISKSGTSLSCKAHLMVRQSCRGPAGSIPGSQRRACCLTGQNRNTQWRPVPLALGKQLAECFPWD